MLVIILKSIKMENSNSLFKGIIIMILLGILACAAICTVEYVRDNYHEDLSYEVSDEPLEMSIEEAVNEFLLLQKIHKAENTYLELPVVIVEDLFKKLGTACPIVDYVSEYEQNKAYYISLQISDQIKKIGLKEKGIDGDNIEEVTIKTKLKSVKEPPLNLDVKPELIQ